ncbi:MAG: hypothetical protein CMF36_07795 [Leeuwenhoekiella sp.]|nr:hypothetical protein [Leeuwenhoekiella sp.]MBA81019.1 hypothetical protein [Leeuwenhoekiella sp.]|tara:strand:- start:2875 stop:3900 length:1026 start_codon:yes stop_codon:yes gene_type:complete
MEKKLKYIFCILSFAVFSFGQVFSATGDGSLSDSNLKYIGRWDKSCKTVYHSYWGGAYFKTLFSGTTVQLKLDAAVNLYVNIDGAGFKKFEARDSLLNLTPTGLEPGVHTLVVAAAYANDEIQFKGLKLDPGAETFSPPVNDLIEFIGNSITSGQNTTKGNLSAYAWLTGESLDLEHTQISQPGITLTDGYHYEGDWAPKRGQISQYFLTKQPNHQKNNLWNFDTYTPKIIVINLGTNDYNLNVPGTIFSENYRNFLKQIRTKFPKTEIFVMRTFGGYYASETARVVDQFRRNDLRIHYIDTSNWLSHPEDFVDTNHPNDQGHIKVALKLSEILNSFLELH